MWCQVTRPRGLLIGIARRVKNQGADWASNPARPCVGGGVVAHHVEVAGHHEDRPEVRRSEVGAARLERVRRRVVPGGAGQQLQPPEPVKQVQVQEHLLRGALGLRPRPADAAEERH